MQFVNGLKMLNVMRRKFYIPMKYNLSTVTKDTPVGIVGCGNVGTAVGQNLTRAGFNVVAGYDIDLNRISNVCPNIYHASTPREVAERSHVIISGLPRPCNVLEAAEGENGILAGLNKDKIWIDHSTTDPDQTKAFSKEATKKGGHILESPITGGLEALKKGQMIVHVGGDEEVLRAVRPILKASYQDIFYVGNIGSAMLVKVVSNMLAAINVVAMGEVLLMAKRSGLDLEIFWDAIRMSAGNSFAWETAGPVVFNKSYDPGFNIALLVKDLQLGYDMARKYQVPIDLNQSALAICRRTQFQLGDDIGCYASPKIYEQALGESLQNNKFKNWSYESEVIEGSLVVKHKGIGNES